MVLLPGFGIPALLDAIARQDRGRPVYCVGYANVGKSRLLNQLLATTSGVGHSFRARHACL